MRGINSIKCHIFLSAATPCDSVTSYLAYTVNFFFCFGVMFCDVHAIQFCET